MWSELLLAMGGHHGELFSRKVRNAPIALLHLHPPAHDLFREEEAKINTPPANNVALGLLSVLLTVRVHYEGSPI